jgi:hypothetical protein
MNSSGSSRRSSDLLEVPSLLTIVQDEIEAVKCKENQTSSCGLNSKSLLQFGLMTINLIFQVIILYKEYNK